jgi:glycosyltransferase involved in cell wall biosynthesis
MNPKGGTELLKEKLLEKVPAHLFDGINLITSICEEQLLDPTKINVLWQHLSYDQPNVTKMTNKSFVDKVDYFIYVSHWQHEKFRYKFNIPLSNSKVIKNAIEPIPYKNKPEKIKLVYSSTPWRGLDVLLRAFEVLNRDDVELDIYSSTMIYGSDFHKGADQHYKHLYEKAKSMKNVNYIGYASNDAVRQALTDAHILAYPSTWEETSCLCAIEAAMAGCSVVTTNYGALYETLGEWGTFVEFNTDGDELVKNYVAALNKEIDNFWTSSTQQRLLDQHVYFSNFYSWDKRAREWVEFLTKIQSDRLSNQRN